MAEGASLRGAGERLLVLLRELDAHADASVREHAREAVAILMEIHREGLSRALALSGDSALGGAALVSRLADDELVGPLLATHDIHPYPAEVRVARALDRMRSRLAVHGCRATLTSLANTYNGV